LCSFVLNIVCIILKDHRIFERHQVPDGPPKTEDETLLPLHFSVEIISRKTKRAVDCRELPCLFQLLKAEPGMFDQTHLLLKSPNFTLKMNGMDKIIPSNSYSGFIKMSLKLGLFE